MGVFSFLGGNTFPLDTIFHRKIDTPFKVEFIHFGASQDSQSSFIIFYFHLSKPAFYERNCENEILCTE